MTQYICGKTYVNKKQIEIGDLIKTMYHRGSNSKKYIVSSINGHKVLAIDTKNSGLKAYFCILSTTMFGDNAFKLRDTTKYFSYNLSRHNLNYNSMPKNYKDIITDDLKDFYYPTYSFSYFVEKINLYNKPTYDCSYVKFLKTIKEKPRTRFELWKIKKEWVLSVSLINRMKTLLMIDSFWYKGQMYYVPGPALDNWCKKYNINLDKQKRRNNEQIRK